MNAFNRLITFLIILGLLVLVVAVALSPINALNWRQGQIAVLATAIARYQALEPTNLAIARAAAVIAALVIFVPLLLAELRRRKGPPLVRMHTATGEAQVTVESIGKRLAWHIDQLADVVAVQPIVRPRGDSVDVTLNVETRPEIEVPMKTEEVMLVAREVVEERMGLKLGRLDVRIHHSDYPPLG